MEPLTIGWIAIGLLFILLFSRMPVAFVLIIVGFGGYWLVSGWVPGLRILAIIPYDKVAVYTMSVLPLFILMGELTYRGGFAEELFVAARNWLAWIPGGLVQATIAGAAAFGAACGSGLASCAVVSRVTIPPMMKQGVERGMAFGAVAAAGTIAQMIPPSVLMVIYGVITEQSIGRLLIAGIIPGLVAAANYMIMVFIRVKRNPSLSPAPVGVSWGRKTTSLLRVWPIALLSLIVMGGIYTGVFTPTEAGALGAFSALVIGFATRRLKFDGLKDALFSSAKTASMIFLIIACAFVFGYFLGISRIPTVISDFLVEAEVPRMVVLIGILVFYVFLGMFLDMIAAMFLTLPIILPAMWALGFDPIWFGVIMVHMCEVALITPPFGLNLFVMKGIIPEAEFGEIVRGIVPYFVMDMVTLAMYVAFPQLALWLPGLMWKG